ncbi:hypothetical protein [Bacillus sp. FJAT-45037]|uniref:hypothetical protein n=1 Tax=Bacillus sp. FJAT-45037 TaxID=2011007 RepID=UPI000C233EFF|nr:hypothetical protein [Bacillus sp. FJAT-45037]
MNTSLIKTALLGSTSSGKLNSYPVLKVINLFFVYLSLGVLVTGLLIALYQLFTGSFFMFILTILGTGFTWGVIKLQAEIIQLVVDIADNTRRSADIMEKQHKDMSA